MVKSINQVTLIGRLTRDPELRSTNSGKNIANFSLAVDRGNDETDFFDVNAWENLGEIVSKYTSKGSKVAVTGRLRLESWETDGQKRSRVVIVAQDVQFLDSKQEQKPKDVVIEDIEDKPIDLSEIPF